MLDHLDESSSRPISPAARTLLRAFATGDPTRPLPRVTPDWQTLFLAVCRHGLIVLAHTHLSAQPDDEYPPAPFRRQVTEAASAQGLHRELIYRNSLDVVTRLAAAGIDTVVVKGIAVAHTIYPHPSLRTFTDLDLVVRERDWEPVHRQLKGMGFLPDRGLSRPPPKLAPGTSTYERQYRHPARRFLVEVHYEDLLNAGLRTRDIDGIWGRAAPIDVRGTSIKVMALDDQLMHLCAHVHYHGYTRLNWLSDLAFLVRDHTRTLDWQRLVTTVRREEAQVPVYYTLAILDLLLDVAPPRDVLTALRPDRLRRWFHEHYLPTEKVVSLQWMPHPFFSFYFLPLFKRLLPDLLVMGRRGEKLRLLLRLLLPPRAWLRYYYHLDDAQPVAPHYLLHPLKLMCHYLAEIAATIRHTEFPAPLADDAATPP